MDILLHDETQLLAWGEGRTVGPWIKLRLRDPEQLAVFRGLDTATEKRSGHILHVTIAQGDIASEEEECTRRWGAEAKALRQSGFFRMPAVWREVGSDGDYLAWVRTQHCAYCGTDRSIDAAHVRRIADGSGTGIKPEYAAIPLCRDHHRMQHERGESVFGGKEWFDRQRIQHVEQWAWEALKATLGAEHWNEMRPDVLAEWASARAVYDYLPPEYRRCSTKESAHEQKRI